MPTNKYYLKTVRNGTNILYDKTLVRNCLNEEVFVNEYVDSPNITIWTDRLNQKSFSRPKSDSYEKCTPIQEDDFSNYFEVSLDIFKSVRFYENTEFFLDNASQGRMGIVAYNNSKDHRLFISIEVDFSLERNEIEISSLNNYHLIRHYRNNATKLKKETFEYLYGETIKFIDDHHNYIINSDNLIKLFKQASEGKLTTIEPIYSEFDLSPVINALNEQIREIEFRLMNNDTDRKASREKIRGRIEGIKRGISEVKRFAIKGRD